MNRKFLFIAIAFTASLVVTLPEESASTPLGGLSINDEIKATGQGEDREKSLYKILRDVHEVLRRMKLDLVDLRHEANRREYVVGSDVDSDMQVIDPWSYETPGLLPIATQSEKEGQYLPPRPKYLDRSISSLTELLSELNDLLPHLFKEEELQNIVLDSQDEERHRSILNLLDQLRSSLAGLKAILPNPANLSLRDSSASFEIKCHDLDALCQTEWSKLKLSKMTGK
jgi:hypothetical protein